MATTTKAGTAAVVAALAATVEELSAKYLAAVRAGLPSGHTLRQLQAAKVELEEARRGNW